MKRFFVLAIVALTLVTLNLPLTAQGISERVEEGIAGTSTFRVTITNLTRNQVLSPPLVVVHSRNLALFELGSPPSDELAALAEDGMTDPLADLLEDLAGVTGVAAGAGPVPPGASISIEVSGTSYHRLSLATMLVNTNDVFAALDSVLVPRRRFSREHYYAVAYDAGSEANNEECGFIPGPACGGAGAGVRAPQGAEGHVYVSNGINGVADLSAAEYDWHNPVAKVVIQRIR